MKEIILMLHPTFGVLGVLATVWVGVEILNASAHNEKRIRCAALIAAVMFWLSYMFGGYWYVLYYAADKAVIKSGPWPFAHDLVMESKEHLFFVLLLLSTYLPIATRASGNRLILDSGTRQLLLTVTTFIVLLGLAMEGGGAVVALGVKLGLLGG
ncbi:MAG: hypothetical protein HY308_17995 [Gammaproteobacteria bacterium]|nr:hypothetical protein [Gammaproteobacteria bacterium]